MRLKGVVVVTPATSPAAMYTGAATQRIANRPIVCHAVDELVSAGIDELGVVAPPEVIEQVRACIEHDQPAGLNLTYLPQTGRLDLVGALQAAAPFVGDAPSVAHFGDGLLGQPLDNFIEAMVPGGPDLMLLLHHSVRDPDRLSPAIQRLLGVVELAGARSHLGLAGVCLFGPGSMRDAAQAVADAGGDADLTTVIERLAAAGSVLEAGFVRSWRRYSGDPLDLLELNRIVLDQQVATSDPVDPGDNLIEGRVIIHPSARVNSSTILGPTIIGPDASVSNSYIGPYTSIGAGAQIEGAEIVRSIVSEGARIMHISGRIEGSTIGPRASIFRDFRLPRAMRLHVGEGVELALD